MYEFCKTTDKTYWQLYYGRKRQAYSLRRCKHCIYSDSSAFWAIAVLSGWGVLKAWEIMFSETFIGGLLLLIVCAAFAIIFLIDGVIGQLIHTVVNFISIFNREERGYAICAFIIALLSIVAMAVVMVILLN